MKLACNTITYQLAGITVPDSIDHMADLGFTYADILCYGKFLPQFYSLADQNAILKRLEKNNMRANTAIYLPAANPGSFSKEERLAANEEFKPVAQFIKRMGGNFVMYCEAAGRPDYASDLDRDQAFDNSIDTIKRFCEWCDGIGVHVLLELIPYGGNFGTIERMKEMLDRVDAPNLWANVDIGHCHLQQINGKRFYQLGEKLVGIHISDNDSAGDEGCKKEADLIIGDGNADFTGYFAHINAMNLDENARKAGFADCVASVECLDDRYIDNPDYQILRCRDYILGHIPVFRDPAIG